MRQSHARGSAIAKQDKAEREAAKLLELAKQQEAQQALERRKSYGRVQRKVASPAAAKVGKRPAGPPSVRPPLSGPKVEGGAQSDRDAGPKNKRGADPKGTPSRSGPKKKMNTPTPTRSRVPQAQEAPTGFDAAGDEDDDEAVEGPVDGPLPMPLIERISSAEALLGDDEVSFEDVEASCKEDDGLEQPPVAPPHRPPQGSSSGGGTSSGSSSGGSALFERRPL